jgi:hypothetical protein
MKRRVALWALAGFTVAFFWFIVGLFTWPDYNLGRSVFVAVTAPASCLGRRMPLAYYWFILLNAAVYAVAGLVIEICRRSLARYRLA